MENNKMKQWAVRLTVFIGIVLLVCTVVSHWVYNLLLPEVTAMEFTAGSLTYTGNYNATATKQTQSRVEVTAKDTWTVTEIFVEEGQRVEIGDPLLAIDTGSYRIQLQQLETSIQQQKNSINGGNWSGGDALVLQMQLEALELQYAQLKSKFPASGTVKASASGQVTELVDLGTVPFGKTLAVITTGDEHTVLQWSIGQQDAENILRQGTKLSCSFSLLAKGETLLLERHTANAVVTNAEYDPATQRYNLYAAVKTAAGESISLPAGTPVQITATTTSQEYPLLVPLGCLYRDTDGGYCIYLLSEGTDSWGLRTQVQRRSVTVLESNHLYAAVQGLFSAEEAQLAAYPSRTLQDGDTVRVVNQK